MPPRYQYWTILAGGLPTAFRAAEREDLLPTFRRIQEKHPDAEMKYFARGRIWDSPEAAKAEKEHRERERGARRNPAPAQPPRNRDWRPGGEHRDPRQPFKDAKKARNQDRRKERFERKNRPPRERPHGDPLRRSARPRPFGRPRFERNQGTEEPPPPPRPRGPDREPRPGDVPKPTPPPRPSEPTVPPPGPPERGYGKTFTPKPRSFKPKPRFGQRPGGGSRGPQDRRRRS